MSQKRIVGAVKKRGYFDGWSDDQLIMRQLCKMMEELGEAFVVTGWVSNPLLKEVAFVSGIARQTFDKHDFKDVPEIKDSVKRKLISELADMQVVLCCLADLLGVDAMEVARKKSEQDIERGVR